MPMHATLINEILTFENFNDKYRLCGTCGDPNCNIVVAR